MKKSVIVIGAGIAGLGAAWELAQNGVPVTIIEANPGLGGRIFTLQNGRIPIELGAEFLHGKSASLLKVISLAGLAIHSAPVEYHVLEKGGLKPVKLLDKVDKALAKADPRKPDLTFDDFIHRAAFNPRTRRLATSYVEGFDAAYPNRIGVHSLLLAQHSAEQMHGSWLGRVDQGYSALVRFLAEDVRRHGGTIVRGAVARRVKWKRSAVEVKVSHDGKNATYSGSAAILTLPLGVWKKNGIKLSPPLPHKQPAVRELEVGNVVKMIFVFRKKWWPPSLRGFIQALDEPFPTCWIDPRGPILTVWAGGPKADAILSSSEPPESLALQTLARIFSEKPSWLSSQLLGTYTHNWAADPHILGAYSYIPLNGLDLPKLLASPVEGTLYFAGEATVSDGQTGTVFGALESGLRAASEFLQDQPGRVIPKRHGANGHSKAH